MSKEILDRVPPPHLRHWLLFELLVDVTEKVDLGNGPLGQRFIVPITGGLLRGGPGHGDLVGRVLPGGADRQQMRPDGVKMLEAIYEVEVEDGTCLSIRNRVLVDDPGQGSRYAMSRLEVTAPKGRWDFLNRLLILGTLQSARPDRAAVIVRAWGVDDRPGPCP